MKLYKVTITPISNFSTTLKGDTLFGQMCWAIRYAFGEERLKVLLSTYNDKPFLVVSDAFATGYLPKPKMPSLLLGEDQEDKKINRKKLWLTCKQLEDGNCADALTNKEANNREKNIVSMHNSLNYKTFMTSDDGSFAPYGEKEVSFSDRDIYFLVDENKLTLDELEEAFTLLSESGYGKDTTIGKGRFEFGIFDEQEMQCSSTIFMTLSPFSPKGLECESIYYEPFTRFGKFGASRAYKSAFKKPILLADVASVVEFKSEQRYQYLGRAITEISDVYRDAVHQGYSIVVPIGVTQRIEES